MVLGRNPIGNSWGTQEVAGGTHMEFKREPGKCTGISKGNIQLSTRGNAHVRRDAMSEQTH